MTLTQQSLRRRHFPGLGGPSEYKVKTAGSYYVQKQYRQIFKELEVPNCALDRIFHYVRLIWLNRLWIDCQYRLRRPVKANTLLAFLGDLLHEQGLYLLY